MDRDLICVIDRGDGVLVAGGHVSGEAVTDAFPSAITDIEEAGKCLAFDRNAACIFHLMRVMEVGLKALGQRLDINTAYKPGWEGILKKAHGQMSLPNDKKHPGWIKDK